MKQILASYPEVERVGKLLTMQLGPDQTLVTVTIKFGSGLDVVELESLIARLKKRIQKEDPIITQIFIEPGAVAENSNGSQAA